MRLYVLALLCLSIVALPATLQAQSDLQDTHATVTAKDTQIVVQAVDGRNGKPLANQRLLVFGGESAKPVLLHQPYVVVTDKGGLATLTLAPETQFLQVWMD